MDSTRLDQLKRLLQHLGIPEDDRLDWDCLDRALTHPSASGDRNYERLEFLGDAALRLAAAEFLMSQFPDATVGELAATRSRLVSDDVLAQIAAQYDLERYMIFSVAARHDLAARQSRLADSLEAILGALYSATQDTQLVHGWLDSHFQTLAMQILQDPALENYKTALQELTQAHYKVLPDYRTQELSQAHGDRERFGAEVWVQGRAWGAGKGRSMKLAEQAAARKAYGTLLKHLSD
ncbi:MAG: ribonuclease III [Cyanobacteria bacterium P01_A01_bin.123]